MKKPAPKRRGRPPLPPGERRQRREFTLPTEVIAMAERIGDGNASAGVEIAVREYERIAESMEITGPS